MYHQNRLSRVCLESITFDDTLQSSMNSPFQLSEPPPILAGGGSISSQRGFIMGKKYKLKASTNKKTALTLSEATKKADGDTLHVPLDKMVMYVQGGAIQVMTNEK